MLRRRDAPSVRDARIDVLRLRTESAVGSHSALTAGLGLRAAWLRHRITLLRRAAAVVMATAARQEEQQHAQYSSHRSGHGIHLPWFASKSAQPEPVGLASQYLRQSRTVNAIGRKLAPKSPRFSQTQTRFGRNCGRSSELGDRRSQSPASTTPGPFFTQTHSTTICPVFRRLPRPPVAPRRWKK